MSNAMQCDRCKKLFALDIFRERTTEGAPRWRRIIEENVLMATKVQIDLCPKCSAQFIKFIRIPLK